MNDDKKEAKYLKERIVEFGDLLKTVDVIMKKCKFEIQTNVGAKITEAQKDIDDLLARHNYDFQDDRNV